MSPEPKPYHHGDLRRTLIDVGVQVLAEDGAQVLSLRKVARRAGVSHNAPYMHFADKEALLAAIAEAGFGLLEQAMRSATTRTPDASAARLLAVSQAYVDFALKHPHHFGVMFVTLGGSYPVLGRAALATFTLLTETLAACQAAGVVREGPAEVMAATIWTSVHGLATLLIARRLSPLLEHGHTYEELPRLVLNTLYEGLRRSD